MLAFRKWGGRFTLLSWMLTAGLSMLLPEPLPGMYPGSAVGVAIVGVLMLVVPAAAVVLTKRARGAWRDPTARSGCVARGIPRRKRSPRPWSAQVAAR